MKNSKKVFKINEKIIKMKNQTFFVSSSPFIRETENGRSLNNKKANADKRSLYIQKYKRDMTYMREHAGC